MIDSSHGDYQASVMDITCDVLVVGAGPAGSSSARSSALHGENTLLIDRKEKIGFPVKCAEGIGYYLLPYLPFEIPKEYFIWSMEGMLFWSDDLISEKIGPQWKSYSVDRKKFDHWLADSALRAGSKVWDNTEVVDINTDGEYTINKVIVKKEGKLITLKPKVVIAADGCESTILNKLDLYHPVQGDLAEVYSWEMANLNLYKPHFEQIYSGSFAPSGYAYIFPKSSTVANIGLGGIFPEKKMEDYFEQFLGIPFVQKQVRGGRYIEERSKKAVWNDLTEKWIYGNTILAGDTANQSLKPFIEGILPSIIYGDIAGGLAHSYCLGESINHTKYVEEAKERIGIENFDRSLILHKIINKVLSKKDKKKTLQFFGIVSELLDLEEIEQTDELTYDELKNILMRQLHGM